MLSYQQIDKEDLKELLNANWMTHDAMWFSTCVQAIGMEKTNDINRTAVRAMAQMEAKRLKKALGVKAITNYEEMQAFLITGFQVIKGSFMRFQMEFPGNNRFIWNVPRCFAYDGVKRSGAIDKYQCGIVERVFGWFDALDVKYTISPKPDGCNMHNFGKCEMEIVFDFEP